MLITRGLKPERDFAIISNAVLRDKSLSFRARGVLCSILSHTEGYKVSSERLEGKEGRDAIRVALDELEAAGYLKRSKVQDGKGRWASSAVISDYPEFLPAFKPTPEKPASVNRASVVQAVKEYQEEDKKKEAQAQKISFSDSSFKHIPDEQSSLWTATYPAVNVQLEIMKAAAWIDANPANHKSDYKRFLNGWLSRAQDKAPRLATAITARPARQAQPAETFRERDARLGREKWELMTGRTHPDSVKSPAFGGLVVDVKNKQLEN
jgi:hypothetical protein